MDHPFLQTNTDYINYYLWSYICCLTCIFLGIVTICVTPPCKIRERETTPTFPNKSVNKKLPKNARMAAATLRPLNDQKQSKHFLYTRIQGLAQILRTNNTGELWLHIAVLPACIIWNFHSTSNILTKCSNGWSGRYFKLPVTVYRFVWESVELNYVGLKKAE